MTNRLVIVESPSKAKTLSKFLGSSYTVKASMGHVRDLPKSRIGVDVEKGFAPEYMVIRGKEKQIKELSTAAQKAETIFLAADPDREGEAIAWHLAQALGLKDPDRIIFHEITKGAVEEALSAPRKINRDLVAAQEARRVIDRLVGYKLSPLLWRKVRTGLSAGRVQSVAVRLVVDREAEIDAFVPKESWTVDVTLQKDGDEKQFKARLVGQRGAETKEETDKLELNTQAEAEHVLQALGFDQERHPSSKTPPFTAEQITSKETTRQGPTPYTTSTLQQDASTRLRFSPKRTMAIAQELYEGIALGEGPVGLITYMRTDSTRIAPSAKEAADAHIRQQFGNEFVGKGVFRQKAGNLNIQDAHEAIRPTDVSRTPDSISKELTPAQFKLYDLIWRRFMASQMSPAKYLGTRVTIAAGDYLFRATGSQLKFAGFTAVWKRDDDREENTLPALAQGDKLSCVELIPEQHFTQPPPRFTEASLIKELEECGVGRPSTYAPTIDTIQERGYVRQEERRLHPTELGKTVDSVLRQNFPDIVDTAFTAELEKRLDAIEGGQRQYEPTVREWYEPFSKTVSQAETSMERVKIPVKETGEKCPECETGMLVVREGKYGEFVGCSRYPECSYVKDRKGGTAEPTGEDCPNCGKALVKRVGRRGPFVGCSGYPSCRFVKSLDSGEAGAEGVAAAPANLGTCPECGKALVERSSKRGKFIGCSGYPSCRYIQPGSSGPAPAQSLQPTGENCPECDKPLVLRHGRFGPFVSCSGYPQCKYRPPKGAVTGISA